MEQEAQKEPVVVMTTNEKFMKDHPLATWWIIGFSVLSVGCLLTVLIITAFIGIPVIIFGLVILGITFLVSCIKLLLLIVRKAKKKR